MKKYGWFSLLGLLLAVCLTGGCANKYEEAAVPESAVTAESETETTKEIKIETETTAQETEEETKEADSDDYCKFEDRKEQDGTIRSFLTGEMVDARIGNRRPIAIMMSNDKAALPQYGINRAGVVYEAPVEGGMNRYLSIIEDYDDLERIGSVRSCRTYYVYFAREFDAIYAHFGQSTFAKPYLQYIDNINGLEGIGTVAYYRSSDKKSPHNAYSSGERLHNAISQLGYSQEYSSSYQGHYRFAKDGYTVRLDDKSGSMDAWKVEPGYVLNKPWFEYNEEDGLYYRYQYGAPHKGSEGQIAVKNIIMEYCPSAHYATTDYLDINVHDDSYGLFITEGKAIPIKWSKDGEFGLTHYYDMEDHEIILNQGKTWVCVVSAQDSPNVKVYGRE